MSTGVYPRRIIFVRHAQSEANADKTHTIIATKRDHVVSITRDGIDQAVEASAEGGHLARLLDTWKGSDRVVPLVVSPYLRTRQTAAIISKELRTKAGIRLSAPLETYLVREREWPIMSYTDIVHKGPEEGGTSQRVGTLPEEEERWRRAEVATGYFFYRSPGGENACDIYSRTDRLLEWLSGIDGAEDTVVIVTHAAFITYAVASLLGLPYSVAENLGLPKNLSVTSLLRSASVCPPLYLLEDQNPHDGNFAQMVQTAWTKADWGSESELTESLRILGYEL